MGDTQLLCLPRLLLGCVLYKKKKKKVSCWHGNINLTDIKKNKEIKKASVFMKLVILSFTELLWMVSLLQMICRNSHCHFL